MSELVTGPLDEEKAVSLQKHAYESLLLAKSINWERVEPAMRMSIIALLNVAQKEIGADS